MEKETVQIAIQIPEAFVEDIEQYIAQRQADCAIEQKVIPSDASKGEELAFDPATLTPIVWVALQFIGGAAVSVAVNVISSVIYDRLKERKEERKNQIKLRFPNGEAMIINPDQPLDVKELEDKLNRSKKA